MSRAEMLYRLLEDAVQQACYEIGASLGTLAGDPHGYTAVYAAYAHPTISNLGCEHGSGCHSAAKHAGFAEIAKFRALRHAEISQPTGEVPAEAEYPTDTIGSALHGMIYVGVASDWPDGNEMAAKQLAIAIEHHFTQNLRARMAMPARS